MRILMAHPGPRFSVHDVHVGWMEAFKSLGCQVAQFNLHDRLMFYDSVELEKDGKYVKALSHEGAFELAANGMYSTLYKRQPDVLFVTSAFFYPPEMFELARRHGTKVVLLHTESPYEDTRQLELASHVDINLINDPTNLEQFKERNQNSYYVPHSYRTDIHKLGESKEDYSSDVCFVGTGFPSRIKYLEAMNFKGLDVLLAGNWAWLPEDSPLRGYVAHDIDECLDNDQTADVYRSAKLGLNLYRREADSAEHQAGWSCGPREIEMAACGLFFLRESRGESDELFPSLPVIESPEDATEKLHWWMSHELKRASASLEARISIRDYTFENRASGLLRLLTK